MTKDGPSDGIDTSWRFCSSFVFRASSFIGGSPKASTHPTLRQALLTLAVHLCFISDRTNLDGSAADGRVLGHQLDRLVQISSFENEKAGQLLLGLSVRAVGHDDLSVLEPQRGCIASVLKSLAAD